MRNGVDHGWLAFAYHDHAFAFVCQQIGRHRSEHLLSVRQRRIDFRLTRADGCCQRTGEFDNALRWQRQAMIGCGTCYAELALDRIQSAHAFGTVDIAPHGKGETVCDSGRVLAKDVRVQRHDDLCFVQRVVGTVRFSKRKLAAFALVVIGDGSECEPRPALIHELSLQTEQAGRRCRLGQNRYATQIRLRENRAERIRQRFPTGINLLIPFASSLQRNP